MFLLIGNEGIERGRVVPFNVWGSLLLASAGYVSANLPNTSKRSLWLDKMLSRL
jgi:hypothetical protein